MGINKIIAQVSNFGARPQNNTSHDTPEEGERKVHQSGQTFLIAYGSWILLGMVLVARVFYSIVKKTQVSGIGDMAARKREVQKKFQTVGLIWIAALPLVFGAYYFLRG